MRRARHVSQASLDLAEFGDLGGVQEHGPMPIADAGDVIGISLGMLRHRVHESHHDIRPGYAFVACGRAGGDDLVLLPDHMHMLWELPDGETDYSKRVAIWKKHFTRPWLADGEAEAPVPVGQRHHRLRGVWQRRFWEHAIGDARDYSLHLDYLHANPVKHGLVDRAIDWPWSTFGEYVKTGVYESDWSGRVDLPGNVEYAWLE